MSSRADQIKLTSRTTFMPSAATLFGVKPRDPREHGDQHEHVHRKSTDDQDQLQTVEHPGLHQRVAGRDGVQQQSEDENEDEVHQDQQVSLITDRH